MDRDEAQAKFREMVARGGNDTLDTGALAGYFTSGTRTGRLSSTHPNLSNTPKSDRRSCVGCESIARQGGGQWRNGEPHYVGCPTELEELRSERRSLMAHNRALTELLVQAEVDALLPKNPKPKRKERTIDLLRRLHGGTWVYNPSSMYPYTQTNTGRRVYFTSAIPQFEDGDSPREIRWEDTKDFADRLPW